MNGEITAPGFGPRHWSALQGNGMAVFVLFGLTFLLYYPALHAQLVSDDFSLVGRIAFDDALRYFGQTWGFGRSEYRPLTALSFALDEWLWADRAEGYHLTNLLLHGLVGSLCFLMLRILTADFAHAILSAGIFIIHPINHSRATWISARDGSVCGVFLLAALYSYIRSRHRNQLALRLLSFLLAILALLSYEGAVILPVLMFAVEFQFFAKGSRRLRWYASLRMTWPYWAIALGYVGLWHGLFSGSLGVYDLSVTAESIVRNYGRLVYTLFYGHRRLAFGIAYLILFALCYRRLRSTPMPTGFAVVLLLVSFLPFCIINGFAHRFGYFSALGFSMLLAACFLIAIRNFARIRRALLAGIAITLCTFYMLEVRKIVSEWTIAGDLAARIPSALKTLHPKLAKGAVLVFGGIPQRHGRAVVFPTGLADAIQREYPVTLRVQQYPDLGSPLDDPGFAAGNDVYFFEYVGGEEQLRQINRLKAGSLANDKSGAVLYPR